LEESGIAALSPSKFVILRRAENYRAPERVRAEIGDPEFLKFYETGGAALEKCLLELFLPIEGLLQPLQPRI